MKKKVLALAAAVLTLTLATGSIAYADTEAPVPYEPKPEDVVNIDGGFSLGDVNLDYKVDLNDAQMALKAAVRIIELTPMQSLAADANKDGKVDLRDAQMVLRAAIGIEKLEGGLTHVHNWKKKSAAEQVWIPNIVVVDDYEYVTVEKGYMQCSCGAKFELDDLLGLEKHMDASKWEAIQNNTLADCKCVSYETYSWFETEEIYRGSHEEDHGWYDKTGNTYVDYYYCDCGATKPAE